jgi:hypothetical protein
MWCTPIRLNLDLWRGAIEALFHPPPRPVPLLGF